MLKYFHILNFISHYDVITKSQICISS